ncbi:MAG: HAD family hydrolase [Clostridia bacterium]|nr:HAD family hydrolase [Clostridia bacterium]
MTKAVLFDLDGTLLDTLDDITARVNETLRTFSYPEISREKVRGYIGDGARQLVERALPHNADNIDECFAFFKTHFANSDNALTKLFAGEEEALESMQARGLKLAIVTNKTQAATDRLVKQFFPKINFAFVGGDSGNFPCKPDPTLAMFAALSMRVSPAECLFVGDGETDVKTALRAGMRGVSCLWGYRTREQLEKAGATEFAESFAELEKFL